MPEKVEIINGVVAEVDLPCGFRRVWVGAVKPDDRFLNLKLYREGTTSFEPVGDASFPYDVAQTYGLLIRAGEHTGPNMACEHCGIRARRLGYRFCQGCVADGVHRRKAGAS